MREISVASHFCGPQSCCRFVFRSALLAVIVGSCVVLFGCASLPNESAAHAGLSVVPASVTFESVVVGQKNSQTLQLTNISKETVRVESIRMSGKGFAFPGTSMPLVLAPGKRIHLTVAFAPTAVAQTFGALEIFRVGSYIPVTVPLSGVGEKAAPQLQLSPSALNFGSLAVHNTSTQTVTLKNSGNIAVAVNSIALPNPNFSVSGISKGVSLSPNQTLQFKVTFQPSAAGATSTGVTIASSSLPAPVTLAVSGSATSAPSNPAAPTPSASAHSVVLNWAGSTSSVAGYHVYRGTTSGGPYSRVSASTISSLGYDDAAVSPGARYFYVVSAIDPAGTESTFSNEASAEVPNP